LGIGGAIPDCIVLRYTLDWEHPLRVTADPGEARRVRLVGPKKILCIHDRNGFVSVFRSYFEERGYQVLAASTGVEGVRLLKRTTVDAVVLDYEAPEMSGAAALQVIKGVPPQTQVLILSGAKSKISPDVRHAATAVLVKVFSAPELMRNVERILKNELGEFLQLPGVATP